MKVQAFSFCWTLFEILQKSAFHPGNADLPVLKIGNNALVFLPVRPCAFKQVLLEVPCVFLRCGFESRP